ncbi:MAG: HAD family hydrolase [Clostridia bacterium]|nr:HAD family hydrolase [Clostridia bacterium]
MEKLENLKVILFDLDGTLLPLDQNYFVRVYFKSLTEKLAGDGYDPKRFSEAMKVGIYKMVTNDGSDTNENIFWKSFSEAYGKDCRVDEPLFEEFYDKRFPKIQSEVGYSSRADEVVKELKSRGYRLVLATNPVFPRVATLERMRWAGISREDFEIITTYENSRYTKPNPDYYRTLAKALGVLTEECLMVGNDTTDDGSAEKAGMKVFILTDCLLETNGVTLDSFPHGGYDELLELV